MADIGEIPPVQPIWGSRRADKRRAQRRPDKDAQDARRRQREEQEPDDERPHIDDYA